MSWHRHYSDLGTGHWRFWCNTRIFFGRDDSRERLPRILPELGGGVALLTDPGVWKLPFTQELLSLLPEPPLTVAPIGEGSDRGDILLAVQKVRESGAGVLLAVGGGSVLDGAKVVSALAPNTLEPEDLRGTDLLPAPPLPLVAVPTTFGTGSEVNQFAHFTDRGKKVKVALKKDYLTPAAAVVHPGAASGAPARLRYLCGVDAFLHALEALTLARENSPVQRLLAAHAVELALTHLRPLVEAPTPADEDGMAEASLLAGMALHNGRTGLIHSLAVPYAARTGLPHSESLLPFVEPVVRFNWEALRHLVGADSCETFLHALRRRVLFAAPAFARPVPRGLDPAVLVEEVRGDTVLFKENPVPLRSQDLLALYRESLGL